jgi:hypothetical protein
MHFCGFDHTTGGAHSTFATGYETADRITYAAAGRNRGKELLMLWVAHCRTRDVPMSNVAGHVSGQSEFGIESRIPQSGFSWVLLGHTRATRSTPWTDASAAAAACEHSTNRATHSAFK